jgi:ATPase subunit of ABC transporter with duplicated ATPase domains
MNTNETKVDVLAVMDEWIKQAATPANDVRMNLELRQARAAVAELIEADREYDEANSDWEEVTSRDPDETDYDTWRRVSDRFEDAVMRRAAAMARLKFVNDNWSRWAEFAVTRTPKWSGGYIWPRGRTDFLDAMAMRGAE